MSALERRLDRMLALGVALAMIASWGACAAAWASIQVIR
jgi:hypothetical protein